MVFCLHSDATDRIKYGDIASQSILCHIQVPLTTILLQYIVMGKVSKRQDKKIIICEYTMKCMVWWGMRFRTNKIIIIILYKMSRLTFPI